LGLDGLLSGLLRGPGFDRSNCRFGVIRLIGHDLACDVFIEIETRTAGGDRAPVHQPRAIPPEHGAAFIGQQHATVDEVLVNADFERLVRLPPVRNEDGRE
jgi:hypothetical protein